MERKRVFRSVVIPTAILIAVVHSSFAWAVDTLEQFDPGASDLEMYFGADGFSRDVEERSFFGEAMAGFGLTDHISAYFGAVLAANGALADGVHQLYLGAYGTWVDTDHFDFDLILEVAEEGGAFSLNGGVEFNFDLKPDLALAGLFVNVGASAYGDTAADDWDTDVDFPFLVGAYWTVIPNHQVLLSYGAGLSQTFRATRGFDVGDVAVGYNVNLLDNFELITEFFVDLPREEERAGAGVSVGFIATMP